MGEIRDSQFHTLIVDESTDISVTEMLIIISSIDQLQQSAIEHILLVLLN